MKTREIKPTRQLIELVCFLRVTLLELTDVALLAVQPAQPATVPRGGGQGPVKTVPGHDRPVQQAAKARSVLHDESKTWQARVIEARELLADRRDCQAAALSLVRKALAEDSQRVHACLAALTDLDFGGREGGSGLRTVEGLDGSAAPGTEMKEDVLLPDVGAAWHGLVRTSTPLGTGRSRPAR